MQEKAEKTAKILTKVPLIYFLFHRELLSAISCKNGTKNYVVFVFGFFDFECFRGLSMNVTENFTPFY